MYARWNVQSKAVIESILNIFRNIKIFYQDEDEKSLHLQKMFQVVTIGINAISVRYIFLLVSHAS